MTKKLLILSYFILIVAAIAYREPIVTWLSQEEEVQLLPITLLAILLGLVPVIPFGVIAAVIGAKFGFLAGGLLNVFASTAAAVIMFAIVRYVMANAARSRISRSAKLSELTAKFETRPFLPLLFARLIPILPAQAINTYAAISRMSFLTFLTATVIGKVPVMITFAIVGDQLFSNWRNAVIVLTVYVVFLLMVWFIYRRWRE
ncbi:TVP38/TMEM64 family protein [Paenibacillus swuensis]|uniref:TVP38/TMEM64 family protein n=1 Tax=Paenibacillus swuensis TaxID=1178515 RepID=UPI000AA034B9|nr:VTT domain-containing protein [Paenibacillus swuensis]